MKYGNTTLPTDSRAETLADIGQSNRATVSTFQTEKQMKIVQHISYILALCSSLNVFAIPLKDPPLDTLNKIAGGRDVQIKFQYDWMLAIYNGDEFMCGGSLIAPNLMVTAARISSPF